MLTSDALRIAQQKELDLVEHAAGGEEGREHVVDAGAKVRNCPAPEDEDPPWRRQALQADRHRQGEAAAWLPAPHPVEQDAEAEATPRQGGARRQDQREGDQAPPALSVERSCRMPRAKGGPKTRRRHKKTMKLAKGFVGGRRKTYRQARETVERGLTYAYRDRKQRKRDFRSLWIVRINAAARANGMSYSRLVTGPRPAGVEVDRQMLAVLALDDPRAFAEIAGLARTHTAAAASAS